MDERTERDSKGRFVAGNNANPKGRPKGSPKKDPTELDIFNAARPEIAMRLVDLTHSDDEAIALKAIAVLYQRYELMNLREEQWTHFVDGHHGCIISPIPYPEI